MGGRRRLLLLRLLTLLDAATGTGLSVSDPEDLASPVAPHIPTQSGLRPSTSPRQDYQPSGASLSIATTTITMFLSSWAGQLTEGKAPAGQETSPVTPPAWLDAGTPSCPSRTGGQPPTTSPPSMTASSMTLLPTWDPLPTLSPMKSHPGQASSPTERGEGGSESQEPPTLTLLSPGSRGALAGQAVWTGVEISLNTKAGPEGSPTTEQWSSPSVGTELADKPPWAPRTPSSRSQVAKTPPGATQGTFPIYAGQPLVKGTGHGGLTGVPRDNVEGVPGEIQSPLLREDGVPSEEPVRGTSPEEVAEETDLPETGAITPLGTVLAKPQLVPQRELGQVGERREEAALGKDGHQLGSPGPPIPSEKSPPWSKREPPWEGVLAVAPSSPVRPQPWDSSSPHPMGDVHTTALPSVGSQWPTGWDQATHWTPTGPPDAALSPVEAVWPESPPSAPRREGGPWEAPGKEEVQPPSLTPIQTQKAPYSTTAPILTTQTLGGRRMNRIPTEDAPRQVPWGRGSEFPSRGSPARERGHISGQRWVFPSSHPEVHSQSMVFFGLVSETVAGPTSETGGTQGAPSHPAWPTHPWGAKPRSPTGSQLKDVTQPGQAETADPWAGQLEAGDKEGPLPAPTRLLATTGPEEVAPEATSLPGPTVLREGKPRAHPGVLVAENQPPLLKAALLPVSCELVLAMEFPRSFQDPRSHEYQSLVRTLNETVSPLLASLPGFHHLEVRNIRPGSIVVEFDALFRPQAPGLWSALNRSALLEQLPPGLQVGNASVLRSATWERHLDLCTLLFSCQMGYECVAEDADEGDVRATCVSLCHRGFCKNRGICTHVANHTPACQCPVGSDFWFLGAHCDYRVTQQSVLGVACGLALSLVVLGLVVAGLVVRRVRLLLLEARADQTKSSYRRFCRLDDVSAHYWSEPWLSPSPSLDNPAFNHSEELLHLQTMEAPCPEGGCRWILDTPGRVCEAGHPGPGHPWAESWSSVNDPMVDSGKASEVSVSSWPLEPPFQWCPFPALQKLPRDLASKTPRPNSCCEGMELVNLERSWTA